MGVINTDMNTMLGRPAIFADLINCLLHGGEQMLTPVPIWNGIVVEVNSWRKAVGRTGDVRMKAENDIYTVSFFDETQAKVDYGMPVRCMQVDVLKYYRKMRDMVKEHREREKLRESEERLASLIIALSENYRDDQGMWVASDCVF